MDETIYDYADSDKTTIKVRRDAAGQVRLRVGVAGGPWLDLPVFDLRGFALELLEKLPPDVTWDDVDLPRSASARLGEVGLEVEQEWEHARVDDEAVGWRADYKLGRDASWRKLGVWPTLEEAKAASPRALHQALLAPLRAALSEGPSKASGPSSPP